MIWFVILFSLPDIFVIFNRDSGEIHTVPGEWRELKAIVRGYPAVSCYELKTCVYSF